MADPSSLKPYLQVPLFGKSYEKKIKTLFGNSLLTYWPLSESSGSTVYDHSGNSRNGVYTGVDLANAAGPTKTKTLAPYFDGVNDYVNVYSTSLRDAFNGAEGTFAIWAKVYSAAEWSDGAFRWLGRFYVDASNVLGMTKSSGAGVMGTFYIAGGVTENPGSSGNSSTAWILWSLTWSKAAELVTIYRNNASINTSGTLGTWAGLLGATTTLLGASSVTPGQAWKGWLSHALLLNRAATLAEITSMYNAGV
jgi:hypothetical protein